MKKQSQKKMQLGRIKVASMNATNADAKATAGTCTILCSTVCRAANTSMGAPICSIDSCRF
ncbi:hypothetical protein ACE38W_15315 [Chitinophaga sp. Hz27]|uniref:hypothetical protein n=1 Tax=Chitinophaga sp. Hz27 TaxID=3347169 RepID=UPI0035D87959